MAIQSLTQEELLRLLVTARAYRERDFLMILVAWAHGLRASEVVNLQADNITDTDITVQRLKGSNRTTQPLLDHPNPLLNERKALFEYTRGMHAIQRLFPLTRERFWQIVKQHATAAGVPKHKRHPHILKHTIAAQLIGPIGIENTRQYLGHKSISSTGEYLKVTDDEASARAQRALRV